LGGVLKRRNRRNKKLIDSPDSVRIWGLTSAAPEPEWLETLYDAVYASIEDADLPEETYLMLARGYPLISGRDSREIAAATFAAMHTSAALGYLSREAELVHFAAADRESAGGEEIPDAAGDLAAAAARMAGREAADPTAENDQRRRLRDRTLSLVARPNGSAGLRTPDGEVTDASLDDFRRVWNYGYFAHVLGRGLREGSRQ
jgi:hypothetical protein